MGISLIEKEFRILELGSDSMSMLLGMMGQLYLPGQSLPLPFELWSRALAPSQPARVLRFSDDKRPDTVQRQMVRKGQMDYIIQVKSSRPEAAVAEAPIRKLGITFARIPAISSTVPAPVNYDTFNCVVAGTLARTMAQVTIHPIDTVKTRLQIQSNCDVLKSWRKAASSSGLKLKLFSRNLHVYNWAAKGVGDLYLGLAATVIGTLPTAFVYFATYEHSKRWLADTCGSGNGLNPLVHLLSASAGAVTSAFIRVPADTLKHQLQAYKYQTLQTALHCIFKNQGIPGLYRGMAATLVRDVPEIAIQFAVYDALRQVLINRSGRREGEQLHGLESLGLGATAGAAAAAVTMPLDVIKTRQQVVAGAPMSFVKALKSVAATEGLSGFFCGLGPRIVQTSVMSAVFFMCFEFWKSQLADMSAKSQTPVVPTVSEDMKFNWRGHATSDFGNYASPLSLGSDTFIMGQPAWSSV